MKTEELRVELNEIERIFMSAKYYELDFKYIDSVKYKHPIVYQTFYFFIERIFHSVSVALILDLCKLFDEREKYCFIRLKNKMNCNYEKSELNNQVTKFGFNEIFKNINSCDIESLLLKLKTTRDEYYAHFDRTRTDFAKIQISSTESGKLIEIAESILKEIQLKYFGISVNYDLTIGELGHNIFDRLNEWEKYREQYGLLRKNS